VYIVPTRYGFLYGIMVIGFLFAGTIFENNNVLIAAAILVTFGLVCMHQTHLNIAQVRIIDIEPESGFSGQTVSWKVRLSNKSPINCFSLNIRDAVVDVPSGDLFIQNIGVVLRKRGPVKLSDLKISSTYPFGLFYAWKYWRGEQSYFVYPSLFADLKIPPTLESKKADLEGLEDFKGHRLFEQGESARHIDWKVYARKQTLMVKLFDTHTRDTIDLSFMSAPGQNVEDKLSFLASLIFECSKLQKNFSLQMPTEFYPASSGRGHIENCLKALAAYEGGHEEAA
jgi:uncharacterized protein (DUF58 family)